ncbi:hypothetical protein CYMTET_30924, partial [Cymbomonas tetramitiformis]
QRHQSCRGGGDGDGAWRCQLQAAHAESPLLKLLGICRGGGGAWRCQLQAAHMRPQWLLFHRLCGRSRLGCFFPQGPYF